MLVVALFCGSASQAQVGLSENKAKAALLYNFMKHTLWPDEDGIKSFSVVFVGDSEHFYKEFLSIAKEVRIRGKALHVSRSSNYSEVSGQHVLVVSPELNPELEAISLAFLRSATLLISDAASDQQSVMINYIYPTAERLSFEVNKSNILYDGLKISNDVLLHGGSEIEVAALYKEMVFSLGKIKADVGQHKRELELGKQELEQKNRNLLKQSKQIRTQQSRITYVAELLEQKTVQLNEQSRKLSEVDKELSQNRDSLLSSQKLLETRELEVAALGQRISQKLSILDQQQAEIEKQRSLIGEQSEKVENQQATISSQRNVIIAVLALLLVFTVLIIWRQKNALARERKLLEAEAELVKAQSASIKAYESSLKLKNDFLSAINHELRTPMNGIFGALQVVDLKDKASIYSAIDIITLSAADMMSLIEDVLTYTEIQSNQVRDKREAVRIRDVLDDLHKHYLVLCKAKGLQLNWQVSEMLAQWVEVDKDKVVKTLEKLLDNAVKFTNEGEVSFSLDYLCTEKGCQFICTIEDTGEGIATDAQAHLFEAFWQRESGVSRRYNGLGIGLAISQKLIHSMGGEINVESVVGRGCKVTVSLLVTELMPVPERLVVPAQVAPWHPILVVEDNRVNQKVLQGMLKKLGYESIVANDGEEALHIISKNRPSLVLMDLQMPKMDGITCTKEIRQHGGVNSDIPIIAVTANLLDSQQTSCTDAGMNGYLGKPVKLSILQEALTKFIPLEGNSHCA